LQNYYSVYDFKDGKIGLVESKTSKIVPNPAAPSKPAAAQKQSKKLHKKQKKGDLMDDYMEE